MLTQNKMINESCGLSDICIIATVNSIIPILSHLCLSLGANTNVLSFMSFFEGEFMSC